MIKAARYDANIHRIMDGDQIVGFASKLTSGRWWLMGTDDSPNDVAAAWATIQKTSA